MEQQLALCLLYASIGDAAASPASALADAATVSKQVRKALDAGDFKQASTLTFTSVEKLRTEAMLPETGADDRVTLQRAACVALRGLARLDEQKATYPEEVATRDRLQTDCAPRPTPTVAPPSPEPDKGMTPEPPTDKVVAPSKVEPTPPKPSPAAAPTPAPPPPIETRKAQPLRTTAITTGALAGAVLIGSAIMAGVIARPGDQPDCPARGCLAGSYGKAYAAAEASWADADPNNNVAHGAGDHICSEASRAANPAVAEACQQRDQLKAGMFASVAVGALLGTAAVVTGVLHARKAKPRYTFSVRPVVGRQWMLSATLRF